MTPAKLKTALSAMKDRGTNVQDLCRELKIFRQTLYAYITPNGEPKPPAQKILRKST